LGAFAATAFVGALAPNHPFETLYNSWAQRRGRQRLPANRAAKRLGCVMGALFLGGATVAGMAGAPTLALVLALVLASVALFVASTGICVPSVIFTALWGARRGQAPTLLAACRSLGEVPATRRPDPLDPSPPTDGRLTR
jgi:hypothetical protein